MRIRNLPFVLLALATAHAHATYFDGETGMLDNGYRTLAPRDGRYIQPDPIGQLGGSNFYLHVGANPLVNNDPLGLWSVTVGAYAGAGGQLTFGRDNGNGFLTGRFGFGLGGGVSYNPTGGIPGPKPQDRSSGGLVLSCTAKANFNAGPLSTSLEMGVARNYSNVESAIYGGASTSARDRFSGLGASGSIGGQITVYSGDK